MPMIQERLNKVGNVLKFEAFAFENVTRKELTVTTHANMEVGEILILGTGKYRRIVAGDMAAIGDANLAVLIDDRVEELRELSEDDDVAAACLVDLKAPVTVREGGLLTHGLTAPEREVVLQRLDELNFKIAELYSTKY